MERSQSCCSFNASNLQSANIRSGYSADGRYGSLQCMATAASFHLHKTIGMRQKAQLLQQQQQPQYQQQFHQQHHNQQLSQEKTNVLLLTTQHPLQQKQPQHQQQQQHLLLKHCASSDNLTTLQALQILPRLAPLRKKVLQRQKSTHYADDLDYAADHEEDDDDDGGDYSNDAVNNNNNNAVTGEQQLQELKQTHPLSACAALKKQHAASTVLPKLPPLPFQKQLRFQKQKQQSETALNIHQPLKLKNNTRCISTPGTRHLSAACSPTTPPHGCLQHEDSFDSNADMSPLSLRRQQFSFMMRDNSIHSDSSRYSSVDSLLEARKPDPEAILLNLGFGPVGTEDILSRIPKRFLKPSQVRGIDTDAFIKRLQLATSLADHSVLGYRGLTGNPDMPPSSIVAKIMERFEVNQRKKSMGSIEHTIQ